MQHSLSEKCHSIELEQNIALSKDSSPNYIIVFIENKPILYVDVAAAPQQPKELRLLKVNGWDVAAAPQQPKGLRLLKVNGWDVAVVPQ